MLKAQCGHSEEAQCGHSEEAQCGHSEEVQCGYSEEAHNAIYTHIHKCSHKPHNSEHRGQLSSSTLKVQHIPYNSRIVLFMLQLMR